MLIFITTILILACGQSFCKLAILPWKWILLPALIPGILPFCFESRIAQSSMKDLQQTLTDAQTLESWCTLVVIQELFTLLVGLSLLADQAQVFGKRTVFPGKKSGFLQQKWKFLAFLPSFLLPVGILYFQMFLFNYFPQWSFRASTLITSAGLTLLLLLIPVLVKLLQRTPEKRALTILHGEFFLLLPAIFLPVAANARLLPDTGGDNELLQGGILLAIFASVTFVFTVIFYFYQLRKKKNVHHYSNS